MPRVTNVKYDLEVMDDLPEPAHHGGSPLEDQLRRILYDAERHAPKWGRIGLYDGANHAAAASSAAQALRRKHGAPDAEGWRFETRRIMEGNATGLFAQYNAGLKIPGKKEENDAEYERFKARQAEAKKIRDENKAKEAVKAEKVAGGRQH